MTDEAPEAPQAEPVPGAVGSLVERQVRPLLIGCDDLREWLIAQGFRVAHDNLSRGNGCNWYAYRRSGIKARECECNDGKPMQIVVRPFKYRHPSTLRGEWQSAEVDVTGEAGGVWFKLSVYSLKHEELRARLTEIEASLIAAWNALRPNVELTGRRRRDGLAVRPMMNQGGCTAKLARRWRSG